MKYKISVLAELTHLSTYTLRYYEKEGLISDIQRDENGVRVYTDFDLEMVKSIECLKGTGMSLKEIKKHIDLFKKGSSTYEARVNLFKLQREKVMEKMKELHEQKEMTDYKIWYYENMSTLGNEEDPLNCQKMEEIYKKENVQ